MTTNYDGVFLRNALGDENTLPRTGEHDTASPDVIVAGSVPIENPQAAYGETYGRYVGAKPAYNETNYLYVRGKNYATDQVVGNATLYWTYARQLDDPGSWTQLSTAEGNNASALAAASEDVGVTGTPFTWEMEKPSSGNPYVLIAVVSDPNNPDPVPDYRRQHNPPPFADWQSEQGGVAALQLAVPTPPPSKTTYSLSGLVVIGNDAKENLQFSIELDNAVVGDEISCTVDAPDISGGKIGLGDTTITKANMTAGFQATVDADFSGTATVEYAAKDTSSPPFPTISLTVSKVVSSGGGGNPFDPNSGNTKLVPVAHFELQTSASGN